MTKLTTRLILFFSLILGHSVYAFDMASMQTPQIQLIKLISFSAEKQQAVFEVDVYNPNDFKIPVRELSGEIFLNKERVSTLKANSKKVWLRYQAESLLYLSMLIRMPLLNLPITLC